MITLDEAIVSIEDNGSTMIVYYDDSLPEAESLVEDYVINMSALEEYSGCEISYQAA